MAAAIADDSGLGPCLSCSRSSARARSDAVGGKKFKIDPQCLLYSLQWRRNGTPPDLHLQLVRELSERCRLATRRAKP